MIAEFEEKAFEGPLTSQLLAGSDLLFTPGQVLESALGFDAAMWTRHMGFWSLWGTPIGPGSFPLSEWWPSRGRLPLPAFRLNLFLQYKRPNRLTRANATEWPLLKAPYFRYETVAHQQAALEACAGSLGPNGLVVYASPAFVTFADLFAHAANGGLVAATNFVEAARLSGHDRYAYKTAGTSGWAFSKPTPVEPLVLPQALSERVRQAPKPPQGSNVLKIANAAVTAAFETVPEILGGQRRAFDEAVRAAVAEFSQSIAVRRPDDGDSLLKAYLRVRFFTWLIGWDWLVGANT